MNFTTYLVSIGFKEMRQSEDGLVPNRHPGYFSSCEPYMVQIRYVKGDIEIIWGLGEAGYPPTLLYPLPKVENRLETKEIIKFISENTNEEIYKHIIE